MPLAKREVQDSGNLESKAGEQKGKAGSIPGNGWLHLPAKMGIQDAAPYAGPFIA